MASITWTSGIAYAPTVELIVNQQSQNIAENYSTIAWSLVLHRPSYVSSSSAKAYAVKIDGVTVASGTTTIGGSGDKIIASGTVNVPHNSDGTKPNMPFSFTQEIGITWTNNQPTGNASGSGTMTLTTIPRASSGSLSNASPNLGDAVTINIARASTAFTHEVYVDWYAGAWTKLTTGGKVATSLAWTVPKSYANNIPNSLSGGGRLLIETYSGTTFIGSTILNFTGNVPDTAEFRPTISQVAIAEAVAGLAAQFAAFVKNKSKLTVTTTAAGAYGSTIAAYRTEVLGTPYTGNPATTAELTSAGTVTVLVTVTDSRGRTATHSSTVTVVDYYTPTITDFKVLRATSAGVEDNDDGNYMKAIMNFSIAPVGNKNSKSYKIEYKKQADTTWIQASSGNVYALNSSYLSATALLGLDFAYDIRLTITDYFGSVAQIFQVGAAFTLIDFAANGQGLAIGKVYEGLAMLELFGDMLIQNRGQDTKLLLEQLQGNAGIEIGNQDLAGLSYIDFHSAGTGTDYDVRLITTGGDTTDGHGTLIVEGWEIRLDAAANIIFKQAPRVGTDYLPWANNIKQFHNVPASNYMAIFDTNGTTYGVTIFVSDERLKKNIRDFDDDGLAKVMAIQHKKFDWRDGHKLDDVGYIAQQLQTIDPAFVYGVLQTDGTEMLSPDVSKILPAVTRAIQQLNDKISTQQATIDALEARLSALENKA
ncbi:tail fiber domain-containing protein [Proteiniclasticum sp. BAD-10]|uniref:Tail fiber domain-containing protein n=1 Tax=Proteiniclasticum sediminis TaxID=2804028 RepID=A0A941CQX2_9CLOT|nr:DUF859 family phage minor structural protein [Proteiniclasticum sediminis]MBR0575676.1 tail fiber domain-containing protein [Proteiniclasticum sediminis]